jgi:hypothetical protein
VWVSFLYSLFAFRSYPSGPPPPVAPPPPSSSPLPKGHPYGEERVWRHARKSKPIPPLREQPPEARVTKVLLSKLYESTSWKMSFIKLIFLRLSSTSFLGFKTRLQVLKSGWTVTLASGGLQRPRNEGRESEGRIQKGKRESLGLCIYAVVVAVSFIYK